MPRNRYTLAGAIIAFLLVANIVYYGFSGWGLITVHADNEPLGKVIKSIEWQGWVKIYSNIDSGATVSMYVDKVTLPEALETLAANITIPPPTNDPSPSGAPDGNGRGGRGGGGFGRGAQWNLAFFIGSSSTNVKEMINSFERGTSSDSVKTYAYPTMLGFLTTNSDDDTPTPTGDPRLQVWQGMKPQIVPVSTSPAAPADATNTPPAPTPPASPDSMQGYLRTFAQASDIFVMSDSSWDPPVANPPPASSSIISAIKNFVSRNHGAVTQAFVLRARGGRGPGGGRGGFAGGDDTGWSMEDRMRNAVNGLPPEARANMLSQLDQLAKLRKDMQNATPEQRQVMRRQQMETRMADNPDGPMRRWSPDKRAQWFQQMVSTRMSAQGK